MYKYMHMLCAYTLVICMYCVLCIKCVNSYKYYTISNLLANVYNFYRYLQDTCLKQKIGISNLPGTFNNIDDKSGSKAKLTKFQTTTTI